MAGGEGLITKTGDVRVMSDGGGELQVQAILEGGEVLGVETFGQKYVIPGIFCLLPALSILATATACRNVYVALFTGLFVGGALATGYAAGIAPPPAARSHGREMCGNTATHSTQMPCRALSQARACTALKSNARQGRKS